MRSEKALPRGRTVQRPCPKCTSPSACAYTGCVQFFSVHRGTAEVRPEDVVVALVNALLGR